MEPKNKYPWTPGPWKFHAKSGTVLDAGGGDLMDVDAALCVDEDEQRDATGLLMSTAPDLYEALEAISEAPGINDELAMPHNDAIYQRMIAALDKAFPGRVR